VLVTCIWVISTLGINALGINALVISMLAMRAEGNKATT
jgi:hypothetical protein